MSRKTLAYWPTSDIEGCFFALIGGNETEPFVGEKFETGVHKTGKVVCYKIDRDYRGKEGRGVIYEGWLRGQRFWCLYLEPVFEKPNDPCDEDFMKGISS